MGRGDLTDAEWERLRPFLPVSKRRCGRWRDHRQVIDGILHRVRTGGHWCDLPDRFGPCRDSHVLTCKVDEHDRTTATFDEQLERQDDGGLPRLMANGASPVLQGRILRLCPVRS